MGISNDFRSSGPWNIDSSFFALVGSVNQMNQTTCDCVRVANENSGYFDYDNLFLTVVLDMADCCHYLADENIEATWTVVL